jgi:hypothetical protein
MRADPAGEILSPGSFGESVAAVAQGGDENGGMVDLAGLAVLDRNGGAGVVDK